MSIKRKGFTLVEIALFLSITALLFAGIIVGTNNSIAQQRYTDAVQNFTELLRSVYSEVSNPQSIGTGRADMAIYGKLISFGQTYGLDGKPLDDKLEQRIFVYDVVGSAENVDGGSIEEVLSRLGANVVIATEKNGDIINAMGPAGEVKSYSPRWGSSIETISKNASNNLFKGSIMVVRHPKSGTINTLVWEDGTIRVNEILGEANANHRFAKNDPVNTLLTTPLSNKDFVIKEVDFCINPRGVGLENDNRRDIRLVKNARNASGVELIDLDLNLLDSSKNQIGNRCRFESGL